MNIIEFKQELIPAIVFTVVYGALGIIHSSLYFRSSIKNSYHLYLVFFCAFRTTAFGLRSAWANDTQSKNLEIAAEASLAGGFFLILTYYYVILLDWCEMANSYLVNFKINPQLLQKFFRIIHISIPIFSILGIIGGVKEGEANTENEYNQAITYRKVSAWGYFSATTLFFARDYSTLLLKYVIPVGSLLIIRTACIGSSLPISSNNQIFSDKGFYPLEAMPEVVLVMYIFATNYNDLFLAAKQGLDSNVPTAVAAEIYEEVKPDSKI